MSIEFLTLTAESAADGRTALARSPMESQALSAGAVFEARDGWNVAVSYGSPEVEVACRSTVGWADTSHLGKLELQGEPDDLALRVGSVAAGATLRPGHATRAAGAWWCRMTAERALVICDASNLAAVRARLEEAAPVAGPGHLVEVTTAYAALTLVGPLAREVLARFCAIDLRPSATPLQGFRPGSVARTPGCVLREDEDRFLVLFGWAHGQYMWTTVADAATQFGGAPVGVDALAPLPQAGRKVATDA